MQSLHTGPSQFSGVESIKLTANASQITIKDSPDNQVHAAKSGGAQLVMKQDGGLLKVTGNAAQFELQVPPGVPVAITSNVSTINDQRAQPGQAAPSAFQQQPSPAPTPALSPLQSLGMPPSQSAQVFQGVTKIEGVNQMGTIEILPAPQGSPTKIQHTGAVLDHEGASLDMVNRGTMTIFTPKETRIDILNGPLGGGVIDKRFD